MLCAAPPNVVLIVSDDHAWTDYGFMGHPQIETPHLDRLARESLAFRRGYVPSSLCCPSLATLITGRYPHEHRVTSNDPPRPAGMKGAEFQKSAAFTEGRARMTAHLNQWPTLPRLLAAAGYVSLQTGKWWQGDYTQGGFTHGMTRGGRHGDDGLKIGRKTMQPITDFIAQARADGKPFFVWYAPLLPHDPHTPPERLLAKYRARTDSIHVARYWANVEWFDETCGTLLDYLDREGLSENTLVLYVADNGWIQNPTNPRSAPRSKQSQYDGGLRTPILARWKGRFAPAMSDVPVSSLDLFPTILKACGITPPEKLPGLDLADSAALAARPAIFGECFTHDAIDLDVPAKNLRWRWVLAGGWKLIVPHAPNESGAPELYHVAEDPHETRDLAAAEPARAAALRTQLEAWWMPEG
jgi:uncharacterized sulfatase